MAKQQTAAEKVRKKKWFPVLAPQLFKEQVMGEIYLYESKAMINRKITVNMMGLTGNPRSQHINILFRIYDVKEGKGLTETLGFEMMPSSVKRIVRRGKTKIDDSLIVVTLDNKKVRIKPLLITNNLVKNPAAASIRTSLRDEIARLVGKLTYEKLVEEILGYKLQKHLGGLAAKITPIRESEIRAFELVEREGVKVFTPRKAKALPKEEEEFEEEQEAKEEETGEKKEKAKEEGKEEKEEKGEAAEEVAEEETSEESPEEEGAESVDEEATEETKEGPSEEAQ
jgi:ribosomal protein S3AE